jgi:hypothetical protein
MERMAEAQARVGDTAEAANAYKQLFELLLLGAPLSRMQKRRWKRLSNSANSTSR